MTNTYDYLQTLIISFENNYHLPLLQAVNNAHITGSAESLIEACNMTDRAVEALLMVQDVALSQLENAAAPLSAQQTWDISNAIEELSLDLQFITGELAALAVDIAEEYALCGSP